MKNLCQNVGMWRKLQMGTAGGTRKGRKGMYPNPMPFQPQLKWKVLTYGVSHLVARCSLSPALSTGSVRLGPALIGGVPSSQNKAAHMRIWSPPYSICASARAAVAAAWQNFRYSSVPMCLAWRRMTFSIISAAPSRSSTEPKQQAFYLTAALFHFHWFRHLWTSTVTSEPKGPPGLVENSVVDERPEDGIYVLTLITERTRRTTGHI
ncbi:hypothetical protein BC826DRAFT_278060 [Russula brevipes]|nr:hypothetical protein BC826DRAFT_278060 [Russula brevipes]